MADENQNEGEDILELGDLPADTIEGGNANDSVASGDAEDDFEIPTFGDPGEEEPNDTDLVKHLRQQLRDRDKRLSEIEKGHKQPEIVVGDEPVWDDNEDAWDWDGKKFAAAHREWEDRKRQAEAQEATVSEAQRKQNEIWQARVAEFTKKCTAYPEKVVNECETALTTTLSDQQRFALIRYAKDPAALTIALGRSQVKLDALAKIEDIGEFIAETARLEGNIKMAKRRPTAQPERIVQGSASLTANTDTELARLEKEAERTGDRTKVVAYKRKLREAA